MASLQRIRNHGGLLITIVGLAMLAFILGDVLTNANSFRHGSEPNFGSVAGNQISHMDFQNTQQFFNNLSPQYRPANSSLAAWESYVQYYTYKSQANRVGMTISSDEYHTAAAMYGMTGFPSLMVEGQWLQNKSYALMQSCLNVNSVEAKFAIENSNKGVSAEYVLLPYQEINAQVTQSDLEAMYKKHKAEYKTDPYRTIVYYKVNYVPSQADDDAAKEDMTTFIEEFKSTDDIEVLLNSYENDSTCRAIQTFTAETVPASFKDFAFGANAQVGACSELTKTENAYEVARIMDINKKQKTVDLAIYKRNVVASDITKQDIENECKHFVHDHASIEEFAEAGRQNGWVALPATVYELTQDVNDLPESRKIVTWAFGVGKDAVSQQVFECNGENFRGIVMVAVVEADVNGYKPLENYEVYGNVHFLAQKEAAIAAIAEQMPSVKSLDEVAAKYDKKIQSVARVTLAENVFGEYKDEPAVVGAALAKRAEIAPIAGNNGVFFVKAGAAFDTNEQITDEQIEAKKAQLSQIFPEYAGYALRSIVGETPKHVNNLSEL
jgi:hypothetical protein